MSTLLTFITNVYLNNWNVDHLGLVTNLLDLFLRDRVLDGCAHGVVWDLMDHNSPCASSTRTHVLIMLVGEA